MEVKSGTTQAPTYERPSLTVLGAARELTKGPIAGPRPDSSFALHSSP